MNENRYQRCVVRRIMNSAAITIVLLVFLADRATATGWAVGIEEGNGLPVLNRGGAPALKSTFLFWRKDWVWSEFSTSITAHDAFAYSQTGVNKGLNFNLRGEMRRVSDRELAWQYEFDAHSESTDVIGGGISYRFDIERFSAQLGEPELLDGNRGWRWGKPGGPTFELSFEPPLARVYFERNQKSEIRAFFYRERVPTGKRRHAAKLVVSDDVALLPIPSMRYSREDPTSWSTRILDWPIAPWNISPVDLSFLNSDERPAGKRGFVKRVGDSLVFADGTPARFWGTNLTADALFETDRENTRMQARRLSELGFNLVRLHHHDSSWVQPNIFGAKSAVDTRNVSRSTLEKLDWWINCLKDEGIYIWIDLHVGREFTVGDGIEGFDEMRKGRSTAGLRGFNYVNEGIQGAMKRFNEQYLGHLNEFTGLQYKDDPAIVGVLLTNENDVTHHFGNGLLPDKKVPHHNAIYMKLAKSFAEHAGLSTDKTWRSWEHGPSKIFLNELEHRFNVDQIAHLKRLGVRNPIATTNTWGGNPISSLPALASGDVIAVHSYGGTDELEKNPIYADNFLHWMAAAQVIDRPLMVTEWNLEKFPAPDRHAMPLYVAANGAWQGWAGLLQYAYSQQAMKSRGSASNWHAFNDPALLATLPAAALLYRRRDVRPATKRYVYAPTADRLFNQLVSPKNAPALRTAVEKGRLQIALPAVLQLPWLEPSAIPPDATIITDPEIALIDAKAVSAASDTGELKRDWARGVYTINTPRTQAAMGWIGGRAEALGDVVIDVSTPNATVAVQSLDSNPINASHHILISLGARAVPQAGNQTPFHSEPVLGNLKIRAKAGLRAYRQHGLISEIRELPIRYDSGVYHIVLDRKLESYWIGLR
jgi:hypothetical protein